MPTPKTPIKSRKVSAYVKAVLKQEQLSYKREMLTEQINRAAIEVSRRYDALSGSQVGQATTWYREWLRSRKASTAATNQARFSHEAEASVVRVVAPR